jgi:hypothetical protein
VRTLSVHLLDGFNDDRVEVIANGEHLSADGVTTKLLLGHAATLTAPIRDSPARVEVRVPKRGTAARLDTQSPGDVHVLASIESGQLKLRVSDVAPGFM